MTIATFSSDALHLLDVAAPIERIATDFGFTKCALMHSPEQAL